MECPYVTARFKGYSDEKKMAVLTALGGVIACPRCKKIHQLLEVQNVQH